MEPLRTKDSPAQPAGQPPSHRRWIIDASLCSTKGGFEWRLLPAGFPPWTTVYHRFRQWSSDKTREASESHTEGFVYISRIRPQLRRLARIRIVFRVFRQSLTQQ